MMTTIPDPLANPAFKAPGLFEKFCEAAFGGNRPFDCAQVEVTSFCGGDCVYCPRSVQAASWKARHMRPETFAALWPLLRKCRRAHLQGWGEPLAHPRFFDFQALAARAGCATSITTSGLAMNEAKAEKIAASGMDLVAFSLAGTDPESNAARRRVPFDRVCNAMRILRQAAGDKVQIHIAYILLADRMEAAARLPELLAETGADLAVVSTLDYLPAPELAQLAFAPHERAKIEKARQILTDAAARAEKIGKLLHFSLPGREPSAKGCRENIGRCLYVDADGSISPCVYLNAPGSDPAEKRRVFGNVNAADPIEIWGGHDFAAFRRELLAGNPEPVCVNCPKRLETEA